MLKLQFVCGGFTKTVYLKTDVLMVSLNLLKLYQNDMLGWLSPTKNFVITV